MAHTRQAFGNRSLAALGTLLILAESFHPVIVLSHELGQTAAWMLVLMAATLSALMLWPVAAMLRTMRSGGLMDLICLAFGRVGAMVTGLLLAAMLTFLNGLILRETSEMAITAAFPHTPQTFATTALLLGSLFVAWGDSTGLVRLGRVSLPSLLTAFLIVMFGSVSWGNPRNLTPIWGPGLSTMSLVAPTVAGLFAPAVLLPLLGGGVRDRPGLVRWVTCVPLIGGVLLALEQIVLAMVFPYPMGSDITFPLHAAARIVVGGRFFERLEGFWLFVWVLSTIVMSGALLWGAAVAITRPFKIPRHVVAVPPLATVVLSLAFFSKNQVETISWHKRVTPFAFAVTLALPALAALVAALRRRGSRLEG